MRDVVRARTPTHARLRDRLVAVALATVGFDIVCAVLAFLFEHHQKQTQIKSCRQRVVLDHHPATDGLLQHSEPDLVPGEDSRRRDGDLCDHRYRFARRRTRRVLDQARRGTRRGSQVRPRLGHDTPLTPARHRWPPLRVRAAQTQHGIGQCSQSARRGLARRTHHTARSCRHRAWPRRALFEPALAQSNRQRRCRSVGPRPRSFRLPPVCRSPARSHAQGGWRAPPGARVRRHGAPRGLAEPRPDPSRGGESSSGLPINHRPAQPRGRLRGAGAGGDFPNLVGSVPTRPNQIWPRQESRPGGRSPVPGVQDRTPGHARSSLPEDAGGGVQATESRFLAALRFAKCMRGRGFPHFPDPTRFDSPPGPILILGHNLFFRVSPSFDPTSPPVKGAVAACGGS